MIYIFFIVPETKNKTFMEINRIMAKRNKVEIQTDAEQMMDLQTVPSVKADKPEVLGSDL